MAALTAETIEFYRPAELPGVEVLLAQHSSRRWRWFHETYSICSIISGYGSVEWDYRGRHHRSVVGHVQLYEPGDVHVNRSHLFDCEFRVLFLSADAMKAAADELGCSTPHWKLFNTADAGLHRSLVAFHAAAERKEDPLEVQSRFAACIRRLLSEFTEDKPPRSGRPARHALLRARDFIHASWSRPVALDDLCRVARLSRYHLARAFAAEFGLPPHAYQMQLRVHSAKQLLAADDSLADVAAATGFCDQSHFTRHFRRLVGVTPSRYVQMVTRRESRPNDGMTS